MTVIITIPAYNEEKTIRKVITDIKEVMGKIEYHYKVLVVDDGGTDKTKEYAKKEGAIVYSHPKNQGLAETFKTEIEQCLKLDADVIVHFDADGQYLAKDIPRLLEQIKKGYDLVLGSRFKGKIEYMPLIKRLGNRAFSHVISQVAGLKISDSQTGFRAFTKKVGKEVYISSNFTYTQEQIIRAAKKKFRIIEIPVYFAKRISGKSRLMKGPINYAAKAWISIFRIYRDYEPLKFFGLFGGLFFLVGFIIGLEVLYRYITTGAVGALPRVMLAVLLISVGIQIFLFGFLADMIRKR